MYLNLEKRWFVMEVLESVAIIALPVLMSICGATFLIWATVKMWRSIFKK